MALTWAIVHWHGICQAFGFAGVFTLMFRRDNAIATGNDLALAVMSTVLLVYGFLHRKPQ